MHGSGTWEHRERPPRGCGGFKALCSFPFEVHNFPATSLYRSGLSSQPLPPLGPASPCSSCSRVHSSPQHLSHCPVSWRLTGYLPLPHSSSLSPSPCQERGFISLHCCTDLVTSLTHTAGAGPTPCEASSPQARALRWGFHPSFLELLPNLGVWERSLRGPRARSPCGL